MTNTGGNMMKKNLFHVKIYRAAIILSMIVILTHSPAYAAPGDVLWKYKTDGQVNSSPVLAADGTVYVGSSDKKLHAIAPDGSSKWTYTTGGETLSAPAVAADGTVYVGNTDNSFYAVNSDGTLKWSYRTSGAVTSSPVIGADGTVYIGSEDKTVYAFNSLGTLIRKYSLNGSISYSSPAVGLDGTQYIGSMNNNIYAVKSNGSFLWLQPYETGGGVTSSPALMPDGTVIVGSRDGYLYAVKADGTLKWKYQTDEAIDQSSPAAGSDGTIYIGSWDNCLHAVNPATGEVKWKFKGAEGTYGMVSSPSVGAGGTIYIGSTDTYLYAVGSDSKENWRCKTEGAIISSAAVGADGTVYVGSQDGYLYAVEGDLEWQYAEYVSPSAGYADSHWPKFGQNNFNLHRSPAFHLAVPDTKMFSGKPGSVSITLGNFKSESIRTVQTTITFDKNIIEVTDATAADGILASGYTFDETIYNDTGKVVIKFTAPAESYVTGEGALVTLQLKGKVSEGMTNLTVTQTKINDFFIGGKSGSVQVSPQYTVSGNVSYFGNKGPVPNVSLTLTGAETYTTATDEQGNYVLTVPAGDYTLTASKSDQLKGLSALDASRILQYALGKTSLNCYQQIAGDVNKDSQITETSGDAAVAAVCSGKRDIVAECEMNSEGSQWAFAADAIETCETWPPISYSAVKTYTALNADKTAQNFTAMLIGDVTGNWYDKNKASGKKRAVSKDIRSSGDIEAAFGSNLKLPLVLNPGGTSLEIEGIDIVVQFDKTALDLADVTLAGGALEASHLNLVKGQGLAAIKIYGDTKTVVSESKTIAFLNFHVIGSADSVSQVLLKTFEQNETAATGGFEIKGSLATEVNVTIKKYDLGDVNHSKSLDLRDAVLALKAAAGMNESGVYTDADVNGDMKIGLAEAVYILGAIAAPAP